MSWLGRVGLLGRAAVYALVGVLALRLALGDGGQTADQDGAIRSLSGEPHGELMLIGLAVGLGAYSAWRLGSAWTGRVDGFKERATAFISGLAYGLLCVTAIQVLAGMGSGTAIGADSATGGVFELEYGRQIVGVVGGVLALEGLLQLRQGLGRKFCEKSRTEVMHAVTEKLFVAVGVAGYCARAVVFGLIGAFLIKAAVEYDAKEAVTLDGALAEVAAAPLGSALLGLLSAGLIAFAVYCVADARYRALQ